MLSLNIVKLFLSLPSDKTIIMANEYFIKKFRKNLNKL